MINSDITYSSEKIWEQSTKEKIFAWAKTISEFAPGSVVRYENANFGGCTQVAAIRYYEDLHTALDKYGLGWFSNDYVEIINCGGGYVGATLVPYYGSNINIELLQQLQKWQ